MAPKDTEFAENMKFCFSSIDMNFTTQEKILEHLW